MVQDVTQHFRRMRLLCVLAICSTALPVQAAVSITHESPTGIEFTYRPGTRIEQIDTVAGEARLVSIRVPGSSQIELDGYPRLPAHPIHFAVPPDGDYRINVVAESWRQQSLNYVQHFAAGGVVPESIIERLPVGQLRSQWVGGVVIHPVVYDGTRHQLEILDSITLRIQFTGRTETVLPVADGRFDDILSRLLINSQSAPALRRPPDAADRLARAAQANPFAHAAIWHKLRTAGDGIQRITFERADSLGLNPTQIADPRQIRVFSTGGRVLPLPGAGTPPELREVALHTQGFEDGSWDDGDFLEFYGHSTRRWEIDSVSSQFTNVIHPFAETNVYWLTPQSSLKSTPLRMPEMDGGLNDPGAVQVFAVPAWAHHEKNTILRIRADGYVGDYYHWYWQRNQQIAIAPFNAVDVVPGNPATVHVETYSVGARVRLLVDGELLLPEPRTNGLDSNIYIIDSFTGSNDIRVDFSTDLAHANYLDSYDVEYHRQLRLRQGKLKFAAPRESGAMAFVITNAATGTPAIWDVTNPFMPVRVANAVVGAGTIRFQITQSGTERRVFWVSNEDIFSLPLSAERRTKDKSVVPEKQVDYIAIGPEIFLGAATEFLQTVEERSGFSTHQVDIEDIYDVFSGGLVDPLAIRWFLKHAFETWEEPAPQYTLLIGDGHYDLADNGNHGAVSYVPPYLAPNEPFPADDGFIYFGPDQILTTDQDVEDPYPDMIIGRWAVKSTDQVRTIAEKIARYQSPETFGAWRNRICLVADDVATGGCSYSPGNEVHVQDAEFLSTSIVPERVEQRKIYLTEYPFGATCRSKPEARRAILDMINEGVALIDFIGHGNPDLWAHEHVLERANDVPRMQNGDRLTLMFTASCSNGFFDNPQSEGLAEEMVRQPNGGAAAAISATRIVFASANRELNWVLFEELYAEPPPRIGEALYLAKIRRQFEDRPPFPHSNDRRYTLFGDPAMRFGAPRYRLVFESIYPETLSALGEAIVTGRVVDADGTTQSDFTGSAEFVVSDAPRHRRFQATDNIAIDYELPGGTIYRGTIPVVSGMFSIGFIVPKDITYGGTDAHITGYAFSANNDAGGGIGGIALGGTVPSLTDTIGPTITIQIGQEPLSDQTVLAAGSALTIVLQDTSGINLTGEPGHSVTVTLEGEQRHQTDITGSFSYEPGSYRSGKATYTVPLAVADGEYTLIVKAWDNANNSEQVSIYVTIGEDLPYQVLELLNYPNPFSVQTTFYYATNGITERATLKVFTVSGRLIKTIDNVIDGETVWDGTDDVGSRVANGVYITKLTAEGRVVQGTGNSADNTISEKIQKVVLWR